jgi:N4-gp56 family major capsid protein
MSINSVIPALWAKRLLENWNDEHVYVSCANRDYEGQIKEMGSTVKINSVGRITITSHTRNTNITAAEEIDTAGQILVIDQGKHFNFQLDDLDKAQASVSVMDAAMEEAAWGLADAVDDFCATTLNAAVPTGNTLSAATVGTGAGESDAYEVLVNLGVVLSENNVPKSGRWVVVPPWFEGMLLKDPRFVSFGTPENRKTAINGSIGRAAGFEIKVSNNVPSSTDILAGQKGAFTFAEQLKEMEAYKPELRFADAMKGLLIYGAKVTRPHGLAKIVATEGS